MRIGGRKAKEERIEKIITHTIFCIGGSLIINKLFLTIYNY